MARVKTYVIQGTVDCGRASGQACEIFPLVHVWTRDMSGNLGLVTVNLSWVKNQLGSYDQDDEILREISVGPDNVFYAIGVLSTRDSSGHNSKRTKEDDDTKVSAPGVTPTTTTTPGASVTATATPTATATVLPINLSLSKVAGPETCVDGDCSTEWTITITNAGPGVAHNVVVIDRPLAGLTTVISASVSQGSYNTATNRWTVGTVNIGPGNAQTATLTFDFSPTDPKIGGYQNQAEVESADETDTNSTPNNNNPAEDDQATELLVLECSASPARASRTPRTPRTIRSQASC